MTQEELKEILENHKHWLNEDCEDWEDMHADLRYADLRYANLSNADLRYADLRYANLSNADLRYANLSNADLSNADLRYANLSDADLSDADLSNANLSNAKNIPFIPFSCPEEGSFIGYKKARDNEYNKYIVKLEILADARRCSATGRKCRCDKAKVLSITYPDGSDTSITEVVSIHNSDFTYKVGEIVGEPNFCEDRFIECAEGIHFFINRQEAVEY